MTITKLPFLVSTSLGPNESVSAVKFEVIGLRRFYRRRCPDRCDSRGTKSRPPILVRLSAHFKDGYGAWEVYKDCDTGSRRVACVHPEERDLEVHSVKRGVNAI